MSLIFCIIIVFVHVHAVTLGSTMCVYKFKQSWSAMRGGAIRYYRVQYSFSQIGMAGAKPVLGYNTASGMVQEARQELGHSTVQFQLDYVASGIGPELGYMYSRHMQFQSNS